MIYAVVMVSITNLLKLIFRIFMTTRSLFITFLIGDRADKAVVDDAARSLYEMCLTEVHAPMENIKQAFRCTQVSASILSNQYQKLYKRIEKWQAIPSES